MRPLSAAAASPPDAATGTAPAPTISRESIFTDFDDVGLRSELNKLRDVENDLMAKVNETSPDIDWDHWRGVIKYPGVVDEMKVAYDSVPVADIPAEMEKARIQVDEVFDPMIKEYKEMAEEAEKETLRLEKSVEEVSFFRDNIKTLTVEEFLEKHPAMKKAIEDDVRNNKWYNETA